MTVISYTILFLLTGACWLFSMLAAFFLGQVAMTHAQQRGRESLVTAIGDLWEKLKGQDNEQA